jgi:hypothetical protein
MIDWLVGAESVKETRKLGYSVGICLKFQHENNIFLTIWTGLKKKLFTIGEILKYKMNYVGKKLFRVVINTGFESRFYTYIMINIIDKSTIRLAKLGQHLQLVLRTR